MFTHNLQAIRKEKGLSQEVLAERLHVVRQTVSKWEKGQSVPDAEMLIRLAEVLETSVATLLGDAVEIAADKNAVSLQLEQMNALLAERNRRSRRIWTIIAIVLISSFVFTIVLLLLSFMAFSFDPSTAQTATEELLSASA